LTIAVAATIAETRERIAAARNARGIVGFVPTMGALHAGHARLIETARAECGFVVVSIFVNPLQFAPNEDFQRYPRSLPADLELCRSRGADLVFAPSVEEMYPVEQLTFAEVSKFSDNLCGAFRPGHFRGVATVVLKLLNIVQPERAYFGEKDLQQLAVIRRMAHDLALPVSIVGVPTVREPDGVALSSRNAYLNAAERRAAPVVYRALLRARELCASGERDAAVVKEAALDMIGAEPLAKLQYVELVDVEIQLVYRVVEGVYAAAAVWFGTTRLIDNIRCL
jgi:pantoate--beta-alanine ligase